MGMQSPATKDAERILKAFANRRRVAIVAYLKQAREASVGNIAREIRLSFKSTSRHLGVLNSAGILEKDQRSLRMYYRIASDQKPLSQSILATL